MPHTKSIVMVALYCPVRGLTYEDLRSAASTSASSSASRILCNAPESASTSSSASDKASSAESASFLSSSLASTSTSPTTSSSLSWTSFTSDKKFLTSIAPAAAIEVANNATAIAQATLPHLPFLIFSVARTAVVPRLSCRAWCLSF